jgi:hypothetical protein
VKVVAADPVPFLSLDLCSAEWLDTALSGLRNVVVKSSEASQATP